MHRAEKIMKDSKEFFREIRDQPDQFYIIHYSSQSLYDDGLDGLSPRITSIVVVHYSTGQTSSFATHAVAETLHVAKCDVPRYYDQVEKELLTRFYKFVRDRREKYWIHWNMRNLTYGFEHLEHRYRTLCGDDPPQIPIELRLNLSDILKNQFGPHYVDHPMINNLMLLNQYYDKNFLDGKEEAQAFKSQEYIRMHSSTISKVAFFRWVIDRVGRGKLRYQGRGIRYQLDQALESQVAKLVAATGAVVGVVAGTYQIVLWLS